MARVAKIFVTVDRFALLLTAMPASREATPVESIPLICPPSIERPPPPSF
jgi:hypothetical protein